MSGRVGRAFVLPGLLFLAGAAGAAEEERADTDVAEAVEDTDLAESAGGASTSDTPEAPVLPPVGADRSAQPGQGAGPMEEETALEDPPRSGPDVEAGARGHVKAFATGTFPYDSPILPDAPIGQGFVDGRLTLFFDVGEVFHAEIAKALTVTLGPSTALGSSPLGTGVGATAPEVMPLTWQAFDADGSTFRLQGRVDRLIVAGHLPHVDLTLGRQPISFGNGRFFTPMDLVSPFTPAVIDTEYKPGVDAFRFDGYPSFSSRITAIAAYTGQEGWKGEWTERDLTAALYGQGTIGVTDLGGMYAWVEGDHVVAATVVTAIGPAGLYGDVAVTVPREDLEDEPFVRATLGMDGRPTGTTTVSAEIYVQTFGSKDASALFETLGSERAQRGEIWLGGLAYLATSLSQEITPLVSLSLATITNLTEPSTLILPSVSWSIAGNADLFVGGYLPVGARPEERTPTLDDLVPVSLRSEFGTYPFSVFLQVRTYF